MWTLQRASIATETAILSVFHHISGHGTE